MRVNYIISTINLNKDQPPIISSAKYSIILWIKRIIIIMIMMMRKNIINKIHIAKSNF